MNCIIYMSFVLNSNNPYKRGFRRAYPLSLSPDAEDPYSKFLNTLGSLYQTTAVAKAREELAKQRREELNKGNDNLLLLVGHYILKLII
jgi:hypothetical protein